MNSFIVERPEAILTKSAKCDVDFRSALIKNIRQMLIYKQFEILFMRIKMMFSNYPVLEIWEHKTWNVTFKARFSVCQM